MIVISIYCWHGRRNATYITLRVHLDLTNSEFRLLLPTNIELLATQMAETLLDKSSCNNKTYYTIAQTKHMLDSLLTNKTCSGVPATTNFVTHLRRLDSSRK